MIEVADSSLLRDKTAKLRIYAAAGVQQYIIVNLVERQVELYDGPSVKDEKYRRSTVRTGTRSVAIAAGASKGAYVTVKARDLLP